MDRRNARLLNYYYLSVNITNQILRTEIQKKKTENNFLNNFENNFWILRTQHFPTKAQQKKFGVEGVRNGKIILPHYISNKQPRLSLDSFYPRVFSHSLSFRLRSGFLLFASINSTHVFLILHSCILQCLILLQFVIMEIICFN